MAPAVLKIALSFGSATRGAITQSIDTHADVGVGMAFIDAQLVSPIAIAAPAGRFCSFDVRTPMVSVGTGAHTGSGPTFQYGGAAKRGPVQDVTHPTRRDGGADCSPGRRGGRRAPSHHHSSQREHGEPPHPHLAGTPMPAQERPAIPPGE